MLANKFIHKALRMEAATYWCANQLDQILIYENYQKTSRKPLPIDCLRMNVSGRALKSYM